MALSKPLFEKLNKIDWDKNVATNLSPEIILETCKITYTSSISIEVIEHLFGGQNMEYAPMELEDSIDCFHYCRQHLLENLQGTKQDIVFF